MSLPGQEDRDPKVAPSAGARDGLGRARGVLVDRCAALGLAGPHGASFRQKSLNNFIQVKGLEHERGEIVDRHERVLATNRPSVNVYVTPAFLPDAQRVLRRLASSVGLGAKATASLSQALSKAVAEHSEGPLLLARGLDAQDLEALERAREEEDLSWEALPILEDQDGSYVAYVDPRHFPSVGLVVSRLAEVMVMDDDARAQLERRVRSARGLERYQDLLVRRDVHPEIEGPLSMEVQLGALPGVTVRRASARAYHYGELASHLLGYVNELSPRDLEDKRELGYRMGDTIGRRGIEAAFEDDLRGTDGKTTVVVDSKGRTQQSLLADSLRADVGTFVAPRPGHRVVLTMDLSLQRAAEERFDGQAGAVVVMEVDTGRILALTSTPSFDPNLLVGSFDPSERRRLDAIKHRRPWRFRAIQDYFAPGSTFKVVTALAALETGAVRPAERVTCPGHYNLGSARFRCWKDHGHGPVDLVHSLDAELRRLLLHPRGAARPRPDRRIRTQAGFRSALADHARLGVAGHHARLRVVRAKPPGGIHARGCGQRFDRTRRGRSDASPNGGGLRRARERREGHGSESCLAGGARGRARPSDHRARGCSGARSRA
ncbi:MAG: hypothetical protein HC923_08900 [Myxococcales bacterium]|nr:hypothetical protein [Myxococcales bacterium]